MQRPSWSACRPAPLIIFVLAICGPGGSVALGQESQDVQPTAATRPADEPVAASAAPNLVPASSLSLDDCINLGMQYQPALAAAQASLAAAQSGSRGVNRLIIPRLFTPDLPIRRQQGCVGVSIAAAGVQRAEWDTRYAITRNFFTVQYVRSQREVVDDVIESLSKARSKAAQLFKAGDPNVKITSLDLDALDIQTGIVVARRAQVENGLLKAYAALREAMGVRPDYELNIIKADLPQVVHEIKVPYEELDEKGQKVKKERTEYSPVYSFNKEELIASALANRGEVAQANGALRLTELEIAGQQLARGWAVKTFAAAADLHVVPIPLGHSNGDYSPGAIGPEMPGLIVGRKEDRVSRAANLNDRSMAVVDKTNNLVAIDVEVMFLKWQEAIDQVKSLSSIKETAGKLPKLVLGRQPTEFTSTVVIQANTTAILVRTQLNEEIYMHALALAGLERATAGAFRIYPVPVAGK